MRAERPASARSVGCRRPAAERAGRRHDFSALARIDGEYGDLNPDERYFRGGGSLIVFDREPDEVERRGLLREIIRAETYRKGR